MAKAMAPYIEGSNRTFTGFKYWAITGHSDDKKPYDYAAARERASEHAASFLADRGAEAAQAQVHMVSVGSDRGQTIVRESPWTRS